MIDLFAIRGEISRKTDVFIFLLGIVVMILIWQVLTSFGLVHPGILPPPGSVLTSFVKMHFEEALVRNAVYSIKLNVLGVLEASIMAIPLGMIIGMFSVARSFASRHMDAIRFLPMTALTGLFIGWFGIDDNMKIQFLAFAIFFYLLPMIVARVDEVNDIYLQTMHTLGATKWQTVRHVFIPYVLPLSIRDIRLTSAISWTYIVAAEMVNASSGGIGAVAFMAGRVGKVANAFCAIFVIIFIGVASDWILTRLEKKVCKFKYANKS